jgi:hypothetical protein
MASRYPVLLLAASLCWAALASAGEPKALTTKVFKGKEGIRCTLVKLATDSVVKKPHLMKVEGSGTDWDGKVLELNEEGRGDRSDFVLAGKKRYVPITRRNGVLELYLPDGQESPLTYSEELSAKADGAALIKEAGKPAAKGDEEKKGDEE